MHGLKDFLLPSPALVSFRLTQVDVRLRDIDHQLSLQLGGPERLLADNIRRPDGSVVSPPATALSLNPSVPLTVPSGGMRPSRSFGSLSASAQMPQAAPSMGPGRPGRRAGPVVGLGGGELLQ